MLLFLNTDRQTEYDEMSRQRRHTHRLPTDRMMHIAQNSGKNFLKIAIPSCQDAKINNSEEEAIVTYESFVASNHQKIRCFVSNFLVLELMYYFRFIRP